MRSVCLDRPSATLYAGTTTGVFASSNGGAAWTPVNTGLTSLSINALVLDSGGTLYAATNGAGAFRLVLAATNRPAVLLPPRKSPPRSLRPRS